jgi:septum formation protein
MIILASQSPRRLDLFGWTGWKFQVKPAFHQEEQSTAESALEYVQRMSTEKAAAVIQTIKEDALVLAADTIVVFEDEILGKPESPQMAEDFLVRLRGKNHLVHTALFIQDSTTGKAVKELCTSQVEMRSYSLNEIRSYVTSGDPMDKAGGYAVQHHGFHPVTHFQGCFANVMGLPLCHVVRAMRNFEMVPPVDVPFTCQKNLSYDCPVSARILKGENVG